MRKLISALVIALPALLARGDSCGWELPWFSTHQPCFLSTPPFPTVPQVGGPTPAFPGAVGWGAQATGGRGATLSAIEISTPSTYDAAGAICKVSTTADVAPGGTPIAGSLRECLNLSNPRTVVFTTGGTFTLNAQIQINAGRSNLTLAGQTAPGGGVQLR
ncbi:MAG: hypothetical protein ACREJC_08025, partial [Tepidisphaeraceae bacterium]